MNQVFGFKINAEAEKAGVEAPSQSLRESGLWFQKSFQYLVRRWAGRNPFVNQVFGFSMQLAQDVQTDVFTSRNPFVNQVFGFRH